MSDYFLDPEITIKEEPLTENIVNMSASVPIPVKRLDLNDYRDLGFDLEPSNSPIFQEMLGQLQSPDETTLDESAMWSTKCFATDMDMKQGDNMLIQMDDDDIFQVDKADLIQGPTLAELNANDENLLADLNFDDLLLPEENTSNYLNTLSTSQISQKLSSQLIHISNNNNNNNDNGSVNNNANLFATSCPQSGLGFYRDMDYVSLGSYDFHNKTFSPTSQGSSGSSMYTVPSPVSPIQQQQQQQQQQQKTSTLHELLKNENYASPERSMRQSLPGPSSPVVTPTTLRVQRLSYNSRLSSSAPTHLGMDQIWQRREPRKHLLSTGSLAEAESTSSLSTGSVLSPEAPDLSHDEFESDEDSEHYEDFSSDNGDSDDDDDPQHRGSSKKERYFWQYNVQAKGPKGQRLILKTKTENPHVLNEVTDPVFSVDCAVRGIKHSGKARKGDGNDLTPNPRKLYSIGKELNKLGKIINDMTPVSELPFNVRPKTRKEKNKLASRACRLKKKAQHEANKIKLQGLETEHKRLMNGINQAKQIFTIKISNNTPEKHEELTSHIEKVMKSASKTRIAGQTTEYVNKILEKVKVGGVNVTMDDI